MYTQDGKKCRIVAFHVDTVTVVVVAAVLVVGDVVVAAVAFCSDIGMFLRLLYLRHLSLLVV